MRANVARMPSNCNLQSYSCFSHQLSLSTVRSKAVQSCLILSTCYEWKIYTFYNSTGQVVSTRQIELSSQNAWLWFTQASASKVVQSYYLYSASAVQSCFYYNTIFIVCLCLLDGGLSLDHCRCDRSIFDRCTFFFRHPSSCSCHPVAIIIHLGA